MEKRDLETLILISHMKVLLLFVVPDKNGVPHSYHLNCEFSLDCTLSGTTNVTKFITGLVLFKEASKNLMSYDPKKRLKLLA